MRAACSELRESEPFSKMLQAVLELGNYLNAGTQRGAAAGFKLDTLLKLADVKGVDRKTSLLQFVIQQLQKDEPRILNLKDHMQHVRPAATMQLSAVSASVGEIRIGLRKVGKEAETAREAAEIAEKEDLSLKGLSPQEITERRAMREAAVRFADSMSAFHEMASVGFEALEQAERDTIADLQGTCEYFGEEFVPADPVRVVRTVRDFTLLLEKAVADLAAWAEKEAEAKKKAAQEKQRAAKNEQIKKRRQPEVEAQGSKDAAAGTSNAAAAAAVNARKDSSEAVPAVATLAVAAQVPNGDDASESAKGRGKEDDSHPNSPPTPQVHAAASPCKESPNADGQ